MHITDITKGMLGVNPIVGAGVAHALGAALSAKVRKTTQVAVAFFGDGACRDRHHARVHEHGVRSGSCRCSSSARTTGTPRPRRSSTRAPWRTSPIAPPAYDMPGVTVDGQDAVAVWEAAEAAVQRARAGEGPSLIECKTYRYYGHHQGDDTLRYRTEGGGAGRARSRLSRAVPREDGRARPADARRARRDRRTQQAAGGRGGGIRRSRARCRSRKSSTPMSTCRVRRQ